MYVKHIYIFFAYLAIRKLIYYKQYFNLIIKALRFVFITNALLAIAGLVFDIELLYRRGIKLPADSKKLRQLQIGIQQLTSTDFKVKLGSIVSPEYREYYNNSKFEFLEKVLEQQLSSIK